MEFKKELKSGLVKKIKDTKIIGLKLTKSGVQDKRIGNSWREIARQNTIKKMDIIESESESESDDDFEIEIENEIEPEKEKEIEIEPEKEMAAINPLPTSPIVEEEPVKEVDIPKIVVDIPKIVVDNRDNEILNLKLENEKLKSGFYFNNHLNRISHLSNKTKLKF